MKIIPVMQFSQYKNKLENNTYARNHANIIIKPKYVNFSAGNTSKIAPFGNISFKGAEEAKPKPAITSPLGSTGFSKVAGMADLKMALRNGVISPFTNSVFEERGIKPLLNIMLYGLPGVGKNYLASAIAEELDAPFRTMKVTDFISKYQHETSVQLAAKFEDIFRMSSKPVLLIQGLEAIAPNRDIINADTTTRVELDEQVNVVLDKLNEGRKRGILVIAATDHPEKVDKSVRDIFKTFFVPTPDSPARFSLFRHGLSSVPVGDDVDIEQLVKRTKNYTAETIARVVNTANIISANKRSETVTMEHLLLALEQIKAPIIPDDLEAYRLAVPTTESTGISSRPQIITFADVAGMKDVKAKLYEDVILPLKNPELYEKIVGEFPNGHLLYGPPGCGKTWIARALAGETGRTFIELDSNAAVDLRLLRKTFNDAIYNAPSILFLDDFEAFVPTREGGVISIGHNQVTSEFLRQLNDCGRENVYVIGATNRPELIDEAVKRVGRFDTKTFIPPLDKKGREELLRIRLKDYKQIQENINFSYLADLTNNFSAAQINQIIRDLKRNVYRNIVEGINPDSIITRQDFVKMIRTTAPELTAAAVKRFRHLL